MSINERKDKSGKIKEVPLEISESETEALNECRRLIADDAELDDLRDWTLVRFLRNNSFAVQPAIDQMKTYLTWRKDNNIDKMLDTTNFASRELIRLLVPYGYHKNDKEGRPIYIEKTGMIATAALADPNICNPQHFMNSHMYGVERLQQLMHEQSLETGVRVNGITTILDFNGLGFQHRSCLFVLKDCLEFDKKYYPEYLGKLYVINLPWVAPYLYQAVQVFLDDVTKSRVQVVSGNVPEFLLERVDAANLPKEYGGSCDGVSCQHGGMGLDYPGLTGCVDVLDSSQLKGQEITGLDSQDISYDFEKVMTASSSASNETFTWYFEVADGYDIDFSVELLPVSGVKETDENKRVLVQKVERLKSGQGTFKAPFPGAKLLFRWDNNFSYFASKKLKYTVSCVHDETGNLQQVINDAEQKTTSA